MSSIDVTFRTLKGLIFKLPVRDSDTVLDLKRRVADHQSVADYAGYRLIHKGKILSDDATVAASQITSAGFVVVMPPKKAQFTAPKSSAPAPSAPTAPTPAPPAPAEPAIPSATPSANAPATPVPTPTPPNPSAAPASTTPATAAPETAASASTADGDSSEGASALVTGSAFNDSVKRICEMGFPEGQVKRAMRAAFHNPNRAVEFLFNGIPDTPANPTTPAQASPTSPSAPSETPDPSVLPATASPAEPAPPRDRQAAPTPASTAPSALNAPGTPFNMFEPAQAGATPDAGANRPSTGNLDILRNTLVFNQIRRIVQTNPAALQQILQQLEVANPALMNLIEANQEEFTNLINEPITEGEDINDEAVEQLANAFSIPPPSNDGRVYVTPEESEQIARLTELAGSIGLNEGHVLQTWLACNRDETLTANFLVDNAEDLRAEQAEENPDGDRTNPPDDAPGAGNPPPS